MGRSDRDPFLRGFLRGSMQRQNTHRAIIRHMLNSDSKPNGRPQTAHHRMTMPVLGLSLVMVISAVSGLNIALPSLAKETGATQSELQWIVDAYTVVFAGLLFIAGALGDRFGRKGVLMAGVAIFGVAAAAAVFSNSPNEIIALRAVMGIGAALTMPTTLSVITTSFPPHERAKAVGMWVGMAGGGAVLGLFASGLLLERYEWNSFFVLNIALSAVAFVGAFFYVPNSRDAEPPRLDLIGAVLSVVAVAGIVFGIIEGAERGWTDTLALTGLGLGLAASLAFVLYELRLDQPLIDPRLFKNKAFAFGTLTITAQFFTLFGLFFVIVQYLQFVVGYSPLKTAACLLPIPFVMVPLARNTPKIAQRFGIKLTSVVGLTSTVIALLIAAQLNADFQYGVLALALVFFSIGMAFSATPSTTAIVSSLPHEKQGVASAVNDVSREFGSALGIAFLGGVMNSAYQSNVRETLSYLPPQLLSKATESVAFVRLTPFESLGISAARVLEDVSIAFTDAISHTFILTAVVVVFVTLCVGIFGPKRGSTSVESVPNESTSS